MRTKQFQGLPNVLRFLLWCCATRVCICNEIKYPEIIDQSDGRFASSLRKCSRSDSFCRTPDLLTKYGYPVETHKVVTSDGFILVAHRIPGGSHRSHNELKRRSSSHKKGRPVILAHALLCSSSDWLMNVPEKALGYKLADAGFDVWLLNSRGNTYSKDHLYLRNNQWEYWDFSFHEMGVLDVPVWIDYILNVTKYPDLYYVGHSMGSTQFFIGMSEHPEYNDKIRTMFAVAPAVFLTYSRYWMFAKLSPLFGEVINLFGATRFLPETFRIWLNMLGYGCATVEPFCDNFFFFVAGYNPKQMNSNQTAIIATHTPDDVSSKTINHFLQIMRSDRFQQYDYGYKNTRKYGQPNPPEYNLQSVTAPVVCFHAKNDIFATPKDVFKTASLLGNVKEVNLVRDPMFTHVDFTYAKDANILVYNRILKIMLEKEMNDP